MKLMLVSSETTMIRNIKCLMRFEFKNMTSRYREHEQCIKLWTSSQAASFDRKAKGLEVLHLDCISKTSLKQFCQVANAEIGANYHLMG